MKKSIISFVFFLFVHYSLNIEYCSAQWVQINELPGIISSLTVSGNNIFAGTGNNYNSLDGVYLSTNNGANWTETALTKWTIALTSINSIIFASAGDSNGDYMYRSTNNGSSWTHIGIDYQSIRCLAVNGNNIYAGSYDGGIYLSTNYGTNWNMFALASMAIGSISISGNNIVAGTGGWGVYLSTNYGMNWTQAGLNNFWIGATVNNGNKIIASGNDSNSQGTYMSTNNGLTWARTLGYLSYCFALSGTYVFAGTENGVYLSTDYGLNWIQKNQGFINVYPPSVHALLIANNYIFAGSGSSVWRRPYIDIINVQNISTETPAGFSLQQNYPNPFNPVTRIRYDLPSAGVVRLAVYDVMGREVETLVNERQAAGSYEATFDGSRFASGVYFYRLTEGFGETKRMTLIK
ncbi:MAG: T9SS type A sorting domain-containing protein [Ignavibacteriae bacterium]|nr:T9SS type A sorting domain-containing protein [Ignavibacteriota bacterium]